MGKAEKLRTALGYAASMRLGLWLMALLLVLFLAGALQMPALEGYESINSVALLKWMSETPLSATWWLWASAGLVALLALNTLACVVQAVVQSVADKSKGATLVSRLGTLLIHVSFLFMALAHMMSSLGSINASAVLREGAGAELPEGSYMFIHSVKADITPEGYINDWAAEVEFFEPSGTSVGKGKASPNSPAFYKDYGLYLKMARPGIGVFEIHREPGAPLALVGAALFTLGSVALTALKVRREQ